MSIDIAIIDSGVNPWHSHVQGVEGGTGFSLDSSGEVVENGDFIDELGHGTAIAGIIREKAPLARLYAVKIFKNELEAPASLLFAALKWAIEKKMKIIHLSLGTEKSEYKGPLAELCTKAHDAGSVVVAAARGIDDIVYPAVFKTVMGVYWNSECGELSVIYHPDSPIEFGAYGRPRVIPGLPQEKNFCGNSFAAAHVTGMAARLLEKNPNAGSFWVREMLGKSSRKGN